MSPLGVYIGWAARRIRSPMECRFCNEKGDVVLVFSGEEYPPAGNR